MITKSDCREVWTEADKAFLIQNYAQGDLTAIAEELSRSKKAIYNKGPEFGLKREQKISIKLRKEKDKRTWSSEEKEIFNELWTSDKNIERIQEELKTKLGRDLTVESIYQRAFEFGFPRRLKAKKMDFDLMELQKAWLAGFFDGEGSISTRCKGGMQIQITNTNKKVIDYLCKILKTTPVNYLPEYNQRVKKGWKDIYRVNITGMENCLIFLKTIDPYLIEKKEKASLAIEFLESRLMQNKFRPYSDRERELREMITKLNKRGRE